MSKDKINLTLQARDLKKQKPAYLRREGLVPAVVYGAGFEPIHASASSVEIARVYNVAGRSHPVHLETPAGRKIAMIKTVDSDPVKRTIRHVAFHAVRQNEIVEADIPIRLHGEGESAAEKAGLVLMPVIDSIRLRAKPLDLPDSVDVDVSKMATTDDKIIVGNISLPKGVELAEDSLAELVVVNVYDSAQLEAANQAAGGDAVIDHTDTDADQASATEGSSGDGEPAAAS